RPLTPGWCSRVFGRDFAFGRFEFVHTRDSQRIGSTVVERPTAGAAEVENAVANFRGQRAFEFVPDRAGRSCTPDPEPDLHDFISYDAAGRRCRVEQRAPWQGFRFHCQRTFWTGGGG